METIKKKSKGNTAEQKRRYKERYPEKIREQKKRKREQAALMRPATHPLPPKEDKPKRVTLGIPFPSGSKEYNAYLYQIRKTERGITQARWRKDNRDKRLNYKHTRRTATKTGEVISKGFMTLLLLKQKGKCVYCHTSIQSSYHIDHIEPLSKGGAHSKSNIQLLCPSCNIRKSNQDPYFFAQKNFGKLF